MLHQGLDLGDKQIDFTHQFHCMYLLGDLNFRLRGHFTSDMVVRRIQKGRHLTLLEHDELTTLRKPYSHRLELPTNVANADQVQRMQSEPFVTHSRLSSQPISRSNTDQLSTVLETPSRHHSMAATKKRVQSMGMLEHSTDYPLMNGAGASNHHKLGTDRLEKQPQLSLIDEANSMSTGPKIMGHNRNSTTLIKEPQIAIPDNMSLENEWNDGMNSGEWNRLVTRRRAASSQSVSSAASSYVTGDDEWDDVEDEDEGEEEDDDAYDAEDGIEVVINPNHIKSATITDPMQRSLEIVSSEADSFPTSALSEFRGSDRKRRREEKAKRSKQSNSRKKRKKMKVKVQDEEMLDVLPLLQSFVEGPIEFAPTYKFEKGQDRYASKRIPAWCDRILWVSPPHPAVSIKQLVYTSSCNTPPVSDHRPVFSEFKITYNQCWDPRPKTQWAVSIRNFYLYLYPVLGDGTDSGNMKSKNGAVSNGSKHRHKQSMGSAELHIRDSTHLVVPYLTVHSPMLGTCLRTRMGRRVKAKEWSNISNSSSSGLSADGYGHRHHGHSSSASSSMMTAGLESDIDSLLCYKFNTMQFVVKCEDTSSLGNGCLWTVIRDDNMLGDVDVIGASAIPLVDTRNLQNCKDYEEVLVHFKREVTLSTSRIGYIEGHLKCECMQRD